MSVLARLCGDIDLAEEAIQDAYSAALERWPASGVPPNPAGWIITTARNRAVDRFRRESSRDERYAESVRLFECNEPSTEEGAVRDDQLRLIFTCCHPALSPAAQIALTLRMLGGLTTEEIARAFLVPEATMAQRLVRAKGKIRDARIPYRIPEPQELPARLRSVMMVVYLVFNEGYATSAGERLTREDLSREAIRLGRLLVELAPDEPEPLGLLALMLLVHARHDARTTKDGSLVLLADQDRSRWDHSLIEEGQQLVRRCLATNRPGAFQIQAAIQAVHADATDASATDWTQVLALYDLHMSVAPSAIVALNRAVAVAEVRGVDEALALVDGLALHQHHLFHAIRADLLRRKGRLDEALAAYDAAITLATNAAERAFLESRRRDTAGGGPAG